MLKIQVIAIGKVKEDWMRQGIAEYQKRLGAYCRFEIIELEEYRLPDNPSEAEIARGLEEEGNRILKKAAGLIFPLCIEGEMLSSPQLAQLISSSAQKSGCLSFIIGGSFGLSPRVKAAAARKISFSRLTFPHQLARVLLCEQLTRFLLIKRLSLCREKHRVHMLAGTQRLMAQIQRLSQHDLSASAAIGCVIRLVVLVERIIADVGCLDLDNTLVLCASDDAFAHNRVDHLRKQRHNVDFHSIRPSMLST